MVDAIEGSDVPTPSYLGVGTFCPAPHTIGAGSLTPLASARGGDGTHEYIGSNDCDTMRVYKIDNCEFLAADNKRNVIGNDCHCDTGAGCSLLKCCENSGYAGHEVWYHATNAAHGSVELRDNGEQYISWADGSCMYLVTYYLPGAVHEMYAAGGLCACNDTAEEVIANLVPPGRRLRCPWCDGVSIGVILQ